MVREGEGEVTIIAVGRMVGIALEAAEVLARRGVEAEVVNARFVKPMDEDMVRDRAERRRLLVTLEENVLHGGFGEAVAVLLQEEGAGCRLLRLGLPDRFVEHGKVEELFASLGLDPTSVAGTVLKSLGRGD